MFIVEIEGLKDCLQGELGEIIGKALQNENKIYENLIVTYKKSEAELALDAQIERLHGPGAVEAIEVAYADGSIFSQ